MVRVAVVFFSKASSARGQAGSRGPEGLAKALADVLQGRGAQVDVIDGVKSREVKLTGYHFLAVGCDVRSIFRGKLPPEVKTFLANSGIVSGKKSMAWVQSSPLGTDATLLQLMKAMEAEGMMLRTSEIFKTKEDAQLAAKRVKIEGLEVL